MSLDIDAPRDNFSLVLAGFARATMNIFTRGGNRCVLDELKNPVLFGLFIHPR